MIWNPWKMLGVLLLVGCAQQAVSDDVAHPAEDADPLPTSAMTLMSVSFEPHGEIPSRYTCEGDDISPPLAWTSGPEGTRSFVLIVDDPDAPDPQAPQMTWVPWVLRFSHTT